MDTVRFNSDVVRASNASVGQVVYSVALEAQKQHARTGDVEVRIRQANASFAGNVGLDLWIVRESLGFDKISGDLRSAAHTVEGAGSDFWHAINRVREAHKGALTSRIDHQIDGVGDLFTRTMDSLSALTPQLDVSRLMHNLEHHEALVQQFSHAGGVLSELSHKLAHVHQFLGQLEADEANLLSQMQAGGGNGSHPAIARLGASSLLNLDVAGGALAVWVHGGPSGMTVAPAGLSVADKASEMAAHLLKGPSGSLSAIDPHWLASQSPEERRLIQEVLARDPKNWSQQDLECVAFVTMAYGRAFKHADFLPRGGNANEFWTNFAKQSDWQEIANGQGMPAPGDILVLNGGSYGHVAIVTKVDPGPNGTATVHFAQSNVPEGAKTEVMVDAHGHISPWYSSYNVQGVIRYIGPH